MFKSWRGEVYVVPDYYENRPKPCVGGWGRVFLAVAPDGLALPCHSARGLPGLELHNVRERSIEWIWNESPGFNHFRGEGWMKEPCSTCDEREKDFGGCHCQAFKLTGDPTNADPTCAKSPHHHLIERAIDMSELGLAPAKPMVFRQRRKTAL
jgi:pyrroloquinoline quinone biosynthesis protein E